MEQTIVQNKLDWQKFKFHFHESFHFGMQEIVESKEMWEIFQTIKGLSSKGMKLVPLSTDLFRSFQIDYNTLRIVLFGMDVYGGLNKEKLPQSNGIALDCTNYGVVSPSLRNFYDGIEKDIYGLNLFYEKDNLSLQYLIDQGVMMTNVGLLTEVGKSGKWIELFKPFWKLVFEKFFNHRSLMFVLLGKEAQKMEQYTQPFLHDVYKTSHPVSASYNNSTWDTGGIFKQINAALEDRNGRGSEIKWLYEPYNDCPFA